MATAEYWLAQEDVAVTQKLLNGFLETAVLSRECSSYYVHSAYASIFVTEPSMCFERDLSKPRLWIFFFMR